MNNIKLKTYLALYSNPFTNFIKDNVCNVLIIGNTLNCSDIFRAVFWCGQLPNIKLNIHIYSSNNDGFIDTLNNNLGGIKEYIDLGNEKSKYSYAELFMHQNTEIINQANYILISNDEFGSEILKNIDISKNHNNLFVISEDLDNSEMDNLLRVAKNINYFYNHSTNIYSDKKESDNRFISEMKLENELVLSINEPFKRYIGAPYAYDSSLAFSVSIPYKFAIANNYQGDSNNSLINAIKEKNNTYDEIIKWEHRRWNAFMITRGFVAPNHNEKIELLDMCQLYSDKTMTHICICESETKSELFYDSDLWYQDTSLLEDRISPLDIVSVKYYQSLCKKIDENRDSITEIINFFKNCLKAENDLISYFANCIEKLFFNSPNAYLIFSETLKNVLDSSNISNNVKTKITEYNNLFNILCKRNQKINLSNYDEKLVNCIPMSIWYEKEATTAIVFSTDNPLFDSTIPSAILAKKIVFFGDDMSSKYIETIKTFFKSRNITDISFHNYPIRCADDITRCYDLIKENYRNVVYCVDKNYKHIIFELNKISDKKNIIALDEKGTIDTINDKGNINCINLSPNFTIKDLLQLTYNYQKNANEIFIQIPNMDKFRKYHLSLCNKQHKYSFKLWNKVCSLFEERKKQIRIDKSTASILQIDEFMDIMEDSNIIEINLQEIHHDSIKYNYEILNEDLYSLIFSQRGKLFELITLFMLKKELPQSNIETSVEILWNSKTAPYNEIDVIAMYNNIPFLISCKDTEKLSNEMIYEISSIASLITGIPILMCSLNTLKNNMHFIQVAKSHKVSIIDLNIYSDSNKFSDCVKSIIKGDLVFPNTN